MRQRWYVGMKDGVKTPFRSEIEPTEATHGSRFNGTIGPFRTKRAAFFLSEQYSNPHCRCVADAERIVKEINYVIPSE